MIYMSSRVASEGKLLWAAAILLYTVKRINELLQYLNSSTFKSSNKNAEIDINLISKIYIYFNKEPDTIYTNSPQQHSIEFICFIGGVISLWTGFSAISMYAYGRRFFRRNQNKVEELNKNNVIVNNHHNHIHNHVNNKFIFLKRKRLIKAYQFRN